MAKIKRFTKRKKDAFHHAIGPVLVAAQFCGVMPVTGVMDDIPNVKFKWLSLQTFAALLLILSGFMEMGFALKNIFLHGLKLGALGTVTFYSICETGALSFFSLGRKWPEIIQQWRKMEDKFLSPAYVTTKDSSLKRKIRSYAFFMIIAGAIEHLLYFSSAAVRNWKHMKTCNVTMDFIQYHFEKERGHVFEVIPYSAWWLPLMEWQNVSLTFCWSFMDIFIVCISIGIAQRLEQLNLQLALNQHKVLYNTFWIEIRNDYTTIGDLIKFLDDELSFIILVSCANDLYFICVQLYYGFRGIAGALNNIYFWFSVAFLLTRAVTMLFFASTINEASKKPLIVLHHVPTISWTTEVQRFYDQIVSETMALSGKKLFYLTRRIILGIAGTIATYELVLMNQIKDSDDTPHTTITCP